MMRKKESIHEVTVELTADEIQEILLDIRGHWSHLEAVMEVDEKEQRLAAVSQAKEEMERLEVRRKQFKALLT